MNKSDLVEAVHQSMSGTKTAAKNYVDATLGLLAKGLADDGKVQLAGFGTFKVKDRAARTARNPATGEPVHVPAKRVVGFKAHAALTEALN